jgi:hypothetical protein
MKALPSTTKLFTAIVLVGVIGGVVEATMDEGTGFMLGALCVGAFAVWLQSAIDAASKP